MRILHASFVALALLTAATAYSRSHSRTQSAVAVTAADPIPLCPQLRCPTLPPDPNK